MTKREREDDGQEEQRQPDGERNQDGVDEACRGKRRGEGRVWALTRLVVDSFAEQEGHTKPSGRLLQSILTFPLFLSPERSRRLVPQDSCIVPGRYGTECLTLQPPGMQMVADGDRWLRKQRFQSEYRYCTMCGLPSLRVRVAAFCRNDVSLCPTQVVQNGQPVWVSWPQFGRIKLRGFKMRARNAGWSNSLCVGAGIACWKREQEVIWG